MNVLYGLHQPDEGEILLGGEPVTIDSPRRAIGLGIGMVHQHFMLVPVMTVAENLVLGAEPNRGPLLDYKAAAARTRELSERFGLAVDPDARVAGPRRRRPAARGDPARAVPRREGARARRADRGAHRAGGAGPVRRPAHADGRGHRRSSSSRTSSTRCSTSPTAITVLRRGEKIDTVPTEGATERSLARLMVGRDVLLRVEKPEHKPGEPLLEVRGLSARDDRGLPAVRDVDLDGARGRDRRPRGHRRQRPERADRGDHGPAQARRGPDHGRRARRHPRRPARDARRGRQPHRRGPPPARPRARVRPRREPLPARVPHARRSRAAACCRRRRWSPARASC